MRKPTGTLATACALSAALAVAGCGDGEGDGHGDKAAKASGEVFFQPVAAPGPDPFTDSTATTATMAKAAATSANTSAAVTRTPQSDPSGETSGAARVRSVSGGMPGLYEGTERVGSCDVDRQIAHLTADQGRARAFAEVEGIAQASIPDHLRALAPVALRADTRVTGHGYRDGRAIGYQSVLQAGTAVLVDNRGVPRVRCASGAPLKPPAALRGSPGAGGRPWAGYRPAQVVVVAPTAQVVTDITIIDPVDNAWIERRIGHDVRHDRLVPTPAPLTPTPSPGDGDGIPADAFTDDSSSVSESVSESATDCVTAAPVGTLTPGATDEPSDLPTTGEAADCPASEPSGDPRTPDLWTTIPEDPTTEGPTTEDPGESLDALAPVDEIGPESVPEIPDLPDGGGLIPDDPDSVLGSPADVSDD